MKGKKERRMHKRYPARDGVFAVLNPCCNITGQVINISRGGLSFRYLFNAEQVVSRNATEVCLRRNGVCIEMLPCKTISDKEEYHHCLVADVKTRHRRIAFEELTYHKASQLEHFLQINTTG